jgi:hypothetical protein
MPLVAAGDMADYANLYARVEPLLNAYEIEESGCLAEISGLGKQFQYPAQGLEICNDI